MTGRQANTLIGLCAAIILTQILCTAVLLRGQTRTHRSVLAIEQQISGADDSTATDAQERSTAGPVPAPGFGTPPSMPPPAATAVTQLRIVFPEEDIRNAKKRVEDAKTELRQATSELDKLVHGD